MADTTTTTITPAIAEANLLLDSIQHLCTSEWASKGHQWVRNYLRARAQGTGLHLDLEMYASECERPQLVWAAHAALDGSREFLLAHLKAYVAIAAVQS